MTSSPSFSFVLAQCQDHRDPRVNFLLQKDRQGSTGEMHLEPLNFRLHSTKDHDRPPTYRSVIVDQWSLILSIDMTCPVDPFRWRLTSTSNQITMNSDIKYPCAVAPLADPNLVVCQKRETITALFYFRPTNRAFVIFVCSWFPFIYAIIAALPSSPPPPDPEVVVVVAATQWRCHMMKHISDRFA